MKILNNFLFTLATILILALSALFAAPYFIDWNEYRDFLEDQASKAAGRQVKVAGKVDLRLLPVPFVRFGDVTIAAGNAASEAPFLHTKTFTMWLAVSPLLSGTLEAREMKIDGATLNLAFDSDGTPNWANLEEAEARASWIPKNVALNAVEIANSTITLKAGDTTSPVTLENVNGNLSAKSLEGPYKFSGSWSSQGALRDVRLSTGLLEASGVMRVRSVIRLPSTDAVFNLDGEAQISDGAPAFAGVLVAKVPPLLKGGSGRKTADRSKNTNVDFVEIKSALDVTAKRALFNNVVISYERQSRPQLINGEAIVDWNRGLNVTGRISAKLLDLDQILKGGEGNAAPADVLGLLKDIIHKTGPYVSKATIRTQIEQTSLGGELVQSVDMQLTKSGEAFEISSLKAELPGNNALALAGRLMPHREDLGFAGPIAMEGYNLARLLKWMGLDISTASSAVGMSGYALSGVAKLAPGQISVSDIRGELGDAAIAANLDYRFAGEKALSVQLETNKLNLKEVLGDSASLKSLRALLLGDGQEKAVEAARRQTTRLGLPTAMEAAIDLRVGHAILQNFDARDVVIKARTADEKIVVDAFSISTDDGLDLRADGVMDVTGEGRTGSLSLSLEAETKKALAPLTQALGFDEKQSGESSLDALVPLRLAVSLGPLPRNPTGMLARISGTAQALDVSLNASLSEGLLRLTSAPLSLTGKVDGQDTSKIIRLLTGLSKGDGLALQNAAVLPQKGKLTIRARGVLDKDVQTSLKLVSSHFQGNFDGSVRLASDKLVAVGQLDVKASEASTFFAAAGLPIRFAENELFTISGRFAKQGQAYGLTDMTGILAAAKFKGSAKLDVTNAPIVIDAGIGVSEADLPILLSLLVDEAPKVTNGSGELGQEGKQYWTKRAFNKEILKKIEGELRFGVGALKLGPNISVSDAGLVANVGDGVELSLVSGTLFGGKVKADLTLAGNGAGLKLIGSSKLEDAKLEALTAVNTGKALASGTLNVSLNFEGQGLSPRGLVSVVSGNGAISIKKGKIFNLSPEALPKILGGGVEKRYEESLSTLLLERFKEKSFPLARLQVPLEISHGSIRTKQVKLAHKSTSATVKSSLALADLKLRSDWALSAKLANRKDAPPVALYFAGTLDKFGAMKLVLDTKLLERYLTVEKMERDVEKLEELQRRDRERLEQQRLQRTPMAPLPAPHKPSIATPSLPPVTRNNDWGDVQSAPLDGDLLPSRNFEAPPTASDGLSAEELRRVVPPPSRTPGGFESEREPFAGWN